MIATKLQAYQSLSGEKRQPQSLYLAEYFCVVSEHQYSIARTDDFGRGLKKKRAGPSMEP